MDFVASLPTFNQDLDVKTTYEWFASLFGEKPVVCFYKYPFIGTIGTPDLVFISRDYQPLVIKCFDTQIEQVIDVTEQHWKIKIDSDPEDQDAPALISDDLAVELKGRFARVRQLRGKLDPVAVASIPRIPENEFFNRFGLTKGGRYLWAGGAQAESLLIPLESRFDEEEWRLTRSILQTALPLTKSPGGNIRTADSVGAAIRMLDSNIALLDDQQMKVAIQIPPGPQRIRGLAGTGKTVLLAMKAANIHKLYPDKRILFTFHTQSLYNQARNLVTRFFRFYSDVDPNWENLHVRHAWGGRSRPGVYFDLTQRQGSAFLNFSEARLIDRQAPFRACCIAARNARIDPYYDYILVDEAQDFPKEFFPILYNLAKPPKPIYWAYDELQSLASLEIPSPADLFGYDSEGRPLVSLDVAEDDGMDRDLVLNRSYRCPRDVLMLAHGLGLGIHNPRGAVQMLADEASWRAVGYELQSGSLNPGKPVVLHRPEENSPTLITKIYTGTKRLIERNAFNSREEELDWIAKSIQNDVHVENVPPESIVVISLDSLPAKRYMMSLQRLLMSHNVGSTIPGLVDAASDFAEAGLVTLSTVFRAKGNEAPIVYILGFEHLYSFAEEIENRNRAFTAISRTKGWVRITGVGPTMANISKEIDSLLGDLPDLKFVFPDMARIRKLDAAETSRRKRTVKRVKGAVGELLTQREALSDLSPEEKAKLVDLLKELEK
jgi:superfamily I DNA and RNA helicase